MSAEGESYDITLADAALILGVDLATALEWIIKSGISYRRDGATETIQLRRADVEKLR